MNSSEMMSRNKVTRILFMTDVLGGGTGNHLRSLLGTWDKSRWRTEIVCHEAGRANLSGAFVVEPLLPRRLYDRYPISQIRRLNQVKRYIFRNPPDIVHCYFFWSIIYGRILKRLGRIRSLVENREDQGFNWGRHEYALLRLTRAIPDRVICVSEAVRKVVLEKEGLDPKKVTVIHNGILTPTGYWMDKTSVRGELGLSDENLVVGMVSNFNRPIKGVTHFLDAIPLIIQAVPETRFVIFGRGEEELSLQSKARSLGIDSFLVFAGYRENMERYYPIMDISVLTSLSEGLSITILESMSHGLPVVVTRIGGNPEVVVEGGTGYMVQPRDVDAFAKRVVELLRDPNLRAVMGQNGRQRVNERFNIREVALSYLRVYQEILHRKGSP